MKWPARVSNPILHDFVEKLLTKNPVQRLGMSRRGGQDIVDHPWFSGFDWQRLLRKELSAPWVPPIKNPMDTSNFDPFDDPEVIDRNIGDTSEWDSTF